MNAKKLMLASALFGASFLGHAVLAEPYGVRSVDANTVPEAKRCTDCGYVNALEAYDLNQTDEKVLLIDVRGPAEVQFVGVPKGIDKNIPYVFDNYAQIDGKRKEYQREANSGFTTAVDAFVAARGLDKNARLVLICRSGDRSAAAANLLHKSGYTKVMSVVDGFEGDKAKDGEHKGQRVVNGWKNRNLPWNYGIDPAWAYLSEI